MAGDCIEPFADKPLLEVREVSKTYVRGGWTSGSKVHVKALDSVSFVLQANASIAFVGESGSGKSTLAMCICGLEEPDSGTVLLDGSNLLELSGERLRQARAKVQMIFQDAATSFNPTFTAVQVVAEPMVIQRKGRGNEQKGKAIHLMESVGLAADSGQRSPMQFSGGQRQRLAIARALAAEPQIIILDEALSGLDMSIQAEIAELLLKTQAERSVALIYISHDMELAGALAQVIAVMSSGRIVEMGPSSDLLRHARHPQTQALVGAMLSFPNHP